MYANRYIRSYVGGQKKTKKPQNPYIGRIKKNLKSIVARQKSVLEPKIIIDLESDYPVLAFDESKEDKQYEDYARFVHIGQRKLFMAEFSHLTNCLENCNEPAIVVYIGAAPTNKGWHIFRYFPNLKFVMIDPNQFNIIIDGTGHNFRNEPVGGQKSVVYLKYSSTNIQQIAGIKPENYGLQFFDGKKNIIIKNKYGTKLPSDFMTYQDACVNQIINGDEKIYIIEDYFTSETAHFIQKLFTASQCKTIIWSDMRSDNISTNILLDTARVYSWTQIAQPDFAMFKFRCPFETTIDYDSNKTDFDEALELGLDLYNLDSHMRFYRGIIRTQCWCGRNSAETRLWVDGADIKNREFYDYDRLRYEGQLCYYNEVERTSVVHTNPNADPQIGFDHCGDCAIENQMWSEYKSKHRPDLDISEEVSELSKLTRKPLNRCGHGTM